MARRHKVSKSFSETGQPETKLKNDQNCFWIKPNVVKTRLKKILSNRGEFIKIQIPDDPFNFDDIDQVYLET